MQRKIELLTHNMIVQMKKILFFALLLLGSTSAYSATVLDSIISTAGRNGKSKAVYYYDANERNNLVTSYVWSANQWVYNSKTENTFDVNGNITEVIYSIWDNNVWANMYRYLYTYDANNAKTSFTYQGWNGTAWENSSRYTYKNREDGKSYEYVYYSWYQGKWFEGDSAFTSYNAAGNPSAMRTFRYHHVESGYERNEWVEASYVGYTYNENNQQTQRLEQVCNYSPNKTYVNYSKYEYEYDNRGDQIHHSYSNWSNNAWKLRDSKDYVYNDAHQLTQSILQNCVSGTCVNSQKEEYTYDAEGNILTEAIFDWYGNDWMQSNNTQYFYHDDGSTAIENIQTLEMNSQKILQDGQLIIIKDGVRYNVFGVELK